MTSTFTIDLLDADATRAWGEAIGRLLRAGDLVVLTGDLGAGKTTLTQGIGAGLGVRGPVVSPTFTIARVLPALPRSDGSIGPDLVHADAYRLGSLAELDALDLDASLTDSVTVVEWGEGLAEALSDDRLEITISRPRGADGAASAATAAMSAVAEEISGAVVRIEGAIDGVANGGSDLGDDPNDDLGDDPSAGTRTVTVRAIGDRWRGVILPGSPEA